MVREKVITMSIIQNNLFLSALLNLLDNCNIAFNLACSYK